MASDSKKASVVPIVAGGSGGGSSHGGGNSTLNRAQLARLPAPVHRLREKSEQLLQQRLKLLFDGADDALFDLADKANSNQDQNLYFDAMREVRLRRREMEQRYFQALVVTFADLLNTSGTQAPEDAFADGVNLDNLSLVDNEQLECHVAVEGMVAKALERVAEPSQHIALRLDSLVPAKVYQRNNPLGPDMLCSNFFKVVEPLEVDIKVKLVLLKLFDKTVVSKLDKIYTVLNNLLIQHNVLPSMSGRSQVRRGGHRPSSSSAQQQVTSDSGAAGDSSAQAQRSRESEVLTQLRGLLATGATEANTGAAVALDAQELSRVLTQLQQSLSVTAAALATAESDSEGASRSAAPESPILSVSRLVEMIQQQGAGRAVSSADRDVINLINMLFQFVLDDGNLAEPMKAMIARLQIPLLKVAVADPAFFSRAGHPARRLLNEMATAALGWQVPEDGAPSDSLYRKMTTVIEKLLSDFDTDIQVFETLLTDFIAFTEKEQRRATVLERRTLDAEDGKARAEQARQRVSDQLEEIVQQQALPECVQQILQGPWHNLLFLTCLKNGVDSEEWLAHCQSAEDLVWSVTTELDQEGRARLMSMLPDLLARLQRGFEGISYNPFDMNKLLEALKCEHLQRLQLPLASRQSSESKSEPVGARGESTAASEASVAAPVAEQSPRGPSAQWLQKVDGFAQGCWFEFREPGEAPCRCRLAAVIKSVDKFIFVNRNGVKVAEKSRMQLAHALQNDRIHLLDDGKLFDRALESVIGNLRESRSGLV